MPQNKDGAEEAKKAGEAKTTVSHISAGATSKQSKAWRVRSVDGRRIDFYPVFELSEDTGDIETRYVDIAFENGKPFRMNWLDLYMFVYFACNEELRRNLAARYERQVNYIPYDVTMNVTRKEWEESAGLIKRRVQLPVEELTMAIARNEAFKMLMKTKDPRAFRGSRKA